MTEAERAFWMAVYVAAVANGAGVPKWKADQALADLAKREAE